MERGYRGIKAKGAVRVLEVHELIVGYTIYFKFQINMLFVVASK